MVKGYYPRHLQEALFLKRENPQAAFLAGGTDFMVGKPVVEEIIFLNQIKELKEIAKVNEKLIIGAGAVYADILQHESIPEVLKKAVSQIASPAVRNIGTIGGNICNASPAGDTLPVLYALSANVVKAFVSETGQLVSRTLPIGEFITGVRKTALLQDEMLLRIEIEECAYTGFETVVYEKAGARKSEAVSKLSFLGMAKYDENVIKDIRIAFGAVAPVVQRLEAVENRMRNLTREGFKAQIPEFMQAYEAVIRPIDDQRSTAAYRREACRNLLRDFMEQVVGSE